ncbi:MAG: diacylglycerol kinase family protein [Ruminococcaceae bacterium]|nr:diacylglycerol kinase family protein [Oscillospiraceae bacterium]
MKKQILRFFRGFRYAFNGIFYALHTQKNMRFHASLMAFMFFFLLRYDFFEISRGQFAVLALTCGIVLSLEFMNSSIEAVVDLVSPEYNRLAGIAKDTAAGAVLMSAIAAVVVGVIIMFQPKAFSAMGQFYATHIGELVIVLAAVVAAVIWIFFPRPGVKDPAKDKKDKKDKK